MKRARLTWVCALAAVLTSGCFRPGDDSEQGLDGDAAASFEGIFEITSWTENDSGCGGTRMDVLASAADRYFVLVGNEVLGQSMLELISCADIADCRAKANAVRNRQSFSFSFGATLSEQISGDELDGFSASTGYEEDGLCTMREVEDHTLTRSGETVTLSTEVKELDDKPPEDGFCVVEPAAAREEAKSAPCVSSSVIKGARVADI